MCISFLVDTKKWIYDEGLYIFVQIIDGKDLLNERTNTELRYLKKV